MFFSFPKDFRERELSPGVVARYAWGQRLMISRVPLKPRTALAVHKHPNEQIGFILEGEVTLTIGGDTAVLRKGDAFLVPPNAEHGGTCGDQGAVVLDIFSPPREEWM